MREKKYAVYIYKDVQAMFYWSFILQVFKSTIDIGKDVYTSGTLSTNIGYKFTTLCDVVSVLYIDVHSDNESYKDDQTV